MSFFTWADKEIKKYHWYDISLIKLSTAAFVLMIAKLWPPLLGLDWYWYLIIALVAALPPLSKMCNKSACCNETSDKK